MTSQAAGDDPIPTEPQSHERQPSDDADVNRDSSGAKATPSQLLTSPGLLYQRVYDLIAADIANGTLAAGARLPAERVLCQRLGVSRATVRRAMRQLAADGLIQAEIGRGSFVTPTPLGESPNALMSFTELGAARGLVATATVLLAKVRPADLNEADVFAIAPGAEIFELKRVRELDSVPVAVDHARIPLNQAPSLPEHDFSTTSLYSVLDRHGVAPVRAEYSVQAIAADGDMAHHLDMEVGEPLLVAATTAFDPSGQLIELTTMSYRGDRYRFQASLSRR